MDPKINKKIMREVDTERYDFIKTLKNGRIAFLYQGTISPERGVEVLIKAWRYVDPSKAVLFLRSPANTCSWACKTIAYRMGILGKSIFFLERIDEKKESFESSLAAQKHIDVGIIPYLDKSKN